MRCTERLDKFQLTVHDVHANQLPDFQMRSGHQRRDSDTAEPENDDPRTFGGLDGIQDGARASLETAAQW